MFVDITGCNFYRYNPVPDRAINALTRRQFGRRLNRRPHIVLCCEGARCPTVKGYRRYRIHCQAPKDSLVWRGKTELVIYVKRRGVKVIDCSFQRVADHAEPTKFAPDRYVLVVRCRRRRQNFSVLVTHWHAVIQSKQDGGEIPSHRSDEARKQTHNIDLLLNRLRDQGYPPILFADSNMRRGKWSLQELADFNPHVVWRGPLTWDSEDIDGYLWDSRKFAKSRSIRFRVPGTDHHGGDAGLAATFRLRKR